MLYDKAMVKHGSTPLGSIILLFNPTIPDPKKAPSNVKNDYKPLAIVRLYSHS